MADLSGFPFFPVEFDKQGKIFDPAQPAALDAHLAADGATDLIVFSHGWNNDMDDARRLYAKFFASARSCFNKSLSSGSGVRFLGISAPF